MRTAVSLFFFLFLLSCSSKYSGLHNSKNMFAKDVIFCTNKACNKDKASMINNFSIISSLHAYGGGGMSNTPVNKISYKIFNICMQKKGYVKDENGPFELPSLTCE